MTGKEKCKVLKEIRRQQAESLGIDLHQRECTYEGECKGTCPKCKAEELQLNAELLKRRALVIGGAIGVAVSLTACSGQISREVRDLEGAPTVDPDYEFPLEGDAVCDPDDIPEIDPDVDPEIDPEVDPEADPEADPDYTLEGEVEYIPEDDPDTMIEGGLEYVEEGDVVYNVPEDSDSEGSLVNKDIDTALDRMFMIESDR